MKLAGCIFTVCLGELRLSICYSIIFYHKYHFTAKKTKANCTCTKTHVYSQEMYVTLGGDVEIIVSMSTVAGSSSFLNNLGIAVALVVVLHKAQNIDTK